MQASSAQLTVFMRKLLSAVAGVLACFTSGCALAPTVSVIESSEGKDIQSCRESGRRTSIKALSDVLTQLLEDGALIQFLTEKS
jgi:hypothetical protein